MPYADIALNVTVGGITISKSWRRSGDHPNPYQVQLPAAEPGELTTRTDDDEGVVTAANTPHGIETADVCDLYWDGGARHGMVAAVSGQAVTLTGGSGDALPAAETDVAVCKRFPISTDIDGDAAEMLAILLDYADSAADAPGHVDFQDGGEASVAALDLEPNKILFVDLAADVANPITGNNIVAAQVSHGDTTRQPTLTIVSIEDRTPED